MLLDEIISNKCREVALLKKQLSQTDFPRLLKKLPPPRDFTQVFKPGKLALVAEVKKASPSAGELKKHYQPARLAQAYTRAGADAISVLTDARYFQGSLAHLKAVKRKVKIPVLRKDFIIDAVQIYESRIAGADAVLLIARILKDSELAALLALAQKLGMQALVEVHNAAEVKRALRSRAKIIGINNRDLDTLKVDIETTFRLLKQFPLLKKRCVVSESGIKERQEIRRLKIAGINGVLIGESLLKSPDIKTKLKTLLA